MNSKSFSLTIVVLALLAMSLPSCKFIFKQKEDTTKTESPTTVVEIKPANEGPQVIEQEPIVPVKSYNSEDLKFRDLYGSVHTMALYEQDCDETGNPIANSWQLRVTEVFDEAGRIVTEKIDINRDENGRILSYKLDEIEFGDSWYQEDYVYGENGLVTKLDRYEYFFSATRHCVYDEDGHLSRVVSEQSAEGEVWNVVMDYKILETDNNGNWTKRLVHHTTVSQEETKQNYKLELRDIVYY
jgi:hypothetical protein